MFPLNVVAAAGVDQVDVIGADLNDFGNTGQASYELSNNGDEITDTASGGSTIINQWLKFGNAVDFEAQFLGSGDATSPEQQNIWYNCNTSPKWGLLSPSGTKLATGSIQVRRASNQQLMDSASLSIEVTGT